MKEAVGGRSKRDLEFLVVWRCETEVIMRGNYQASIRERERDLDSFSTGSMISKRRSE